MGAQLRAAHVACRLDPMPDDDDAAEREALADEWEYVLAMADE